MVLLESEQFLTELTRLFQKCRSSGSVFITLKKCELQRSEQVSDGHSNLLRANMDGLKKRDKKNKSKKSKPAQ